MDARAQTMSSKFSGFFKKARDAAKQQTERAIEEGTKAFDRASKKFDEAVTNFTSIPSDLGPSTGPESSSSMSKAEAADFTRKVRTLMDMGFSREASVLALQHCHGDLEGSASWIIHPRNQAEIARAERRSKQVALLEPGALARLVRLKSAAQFNGTVVRLVWFEENDGRWMVEDTKGALKGIRPQNLQLVQPPDRAQELAAGYGFTTTTTPACSSSCPASASPSAPAAAAGAAAAATSPSPSSSPSPSYSYQLHSQNRSNPFQPPPRTPGSSGDGGFGSLESLDMLSDEELRRKVKELSGGSDLDPALFQALSREDLLETILGLCCQDQASPDTLISEAASSSSAPAKAATSPAAASPPRFAPPTAAAPAPTAGPESAPEPSSGPARNLYNNETVAGRPDGLPDPALEPPQASRAADVGRHQGVEEAASARLKELEKREAELLAAQERMRSEAEAKEAHYKSIEEKCRALESQLDQAQAKAQSQALVAEGAQPESLPPTVSQEDLESERAELKRLQAAALAAEQSLEEQRKKLAAAAEERELRLLEEESEKMREIEEAKERLEIQRKSVLMLQRSLSLRSDAVCSQSSSPIRMNKDRGQSLNFTSHSPGEPDDEAYDEASEDEEDDEEGDAEDEMWDLDWNSLSQKAAEAAVGDGDGANSDQGEGKAQSQAHEEEKTDLPEGKAESEAKTEGGQPESPEKEEEKDAVPLLKGEAGTEADLPPSDGPDTQK